MNFLHWMLLPTGNIENIREIVPKRPGIYAIFYADTGKCFYVGRAMDSIRKRLMMHYGKDAEENYRRMLGELLAPEKFCFWFHEIKRPSEMSGQKFKCILAAMEAMCSAAWMPKVESKVF